MILKYSICDNKPCNQVYLASLDHCPNCGASEAFSKKRLGSWLDYVYDVETYPNAFTCTTIHALTGQIYRHEITSRKNDLKAFVEFLLWLRDNKCRMVGFNNLYFDYNILHFIIENAQYNIGAEQIYDMAQHLINATHDEAFKLMKWPDNRYIEQIDLYKIHHFDNANKRTSLKQIEFAMRAESIKDLPYKPGTILSYAQIDELIKYNDWDTLKTLDFYFKSTSLIQFRENFKELNYGDRLNRNDGKIGSDLMIKHLEAKDREACFYYQGNKRVKKQTIRESINLDEVILPWIQFKTPEFERIKQHLQQQTIKETKGVFKDLTCIVGGIEYTFATGGMHASELAATAISDDDYTLLDIDVKSFYPNMAIKNKWHPEHLDRDVFASTYEGLYIKRGNYSKEVPSEKPVNKAVKSALNTVYGNSNNKHSVFFDSKYTMQTTINGQFLICLLSEYVSMVSGVHVIQVNTDGLTLKAPRKMYNYIIAMCKYWESQTKLTLEYAEYEAMYIRDVNSYLVKRTDGKLKRIGAYKHGDDLAWHQDHSEQVIAKAAQAHLIDSENIESYIRGHTDPYDFCIMMRAQNGARNYANGRELQKITRCFVAHRGEQLQFLRPVQKGYKEGDYKKGQGINEAFYKQFNQTGVHDPRIHTKNMSKYAPSYESFKKGWQCAICDDMQDFDWSNLNYDYYIAEAKKLIDPVRQRVI